MKRCWAVLGLVIGLVALSAIPASAATNLVQNGSFESGFPASPDNNGSQSVGYNGYSGALIPSWTQTGGGVDWHHNVPDPAAPAAQDGSRVIDLVGAGGLGKIEQVIPTTSGMRYTLSFFYAANPACVGTGDATARATAGSTSLDVQSSGSNDYRPATLAFTAADTSTTISFESLDAGAACPGGVTIDNVSVLSDGSGPASCTPPPGPPQPGGVLCETGTSTIRGRTGCQSSPFRVTVSGQQIERVIFTLDGMIAKVLTRPDSAARYVLSVDPRRLRPGAHRVLARVIYAEQSSTPNTTLRVVFSKCLRLAASPVFHGDATKCDGARVDIVQIASKLRRARKHGKRHDQLTAALKKAKRDRRRYCPPE
jgi:hypothetical protein